MHVPVTCAACGQAFRVDAKFAGRRGKCPNPDCRAVYIVPSPDTEEVDEVDSVPEESAGRGSSLSWGKRAKSGAGKKTKPRSSWLTRLDRPSFLVGAGMSAVAAIVIVVFAAFLSPSK